MDNLDRSEADYKQWQDYSCAPSMAEFQRLVWMAGWNYGSKKTKPKQTEDELITTPSHYTIGCSGIGLPIVTLIANLIDPESQRSFRESPLDSEEWPKGECKEFCQALEEFALRIRTHQIMSAIEYLWRAGLKDGEPAIVALKKAQERLKGSGLSDPQLDEMLQQAIDKCA